MLIVYVALAGAIGALARWYTSILMQRWLGAAFPYGTLAVNLVGCFLLGVLMAAADRTRLVSAEVRVVLAVGFIGTFTTFSTFEFETWRLARRGDTALAAGNLAINVIIGYLLLWLGSVLAARAFR